MDGMQKDVAPTKSTEMVCVLTCQKHRWIHVQVLDHFWNQNLQHQLLISMEFN
jgi:hypothetical protein